MKLCLALAGLCALSLVSLSPASASEKLCPAPRVNLARYMGPWRVIACMDNKLERDFVDAVETYQAQGDGKIGVHFAWREKQFTAPQKTHDFTGRVVADGTNAQWKMHLFPLFTASYVIIYVAPDYSLAAVANPSKKYGWVLARQKTIPESRYQAMLKLFAQQGYDTTKFIRLPQVPKKS